MHMDGGGMGLFGLFVGLFWLALVALIVFLVVKLRSTGSGALPMRPVPQMPPAESPEQMLDRMFVTGEIDEPTYRSRRTALADMKKPQ